jgi:hypothetical protein
MAKYDRNAEVRAAAKRFIQGRAFGVRMHMADWPTFAEIMSTIGAKDRELDRALQWLRKGGEIRCVGKRWQLNGATHD